MVSNTNMIMHFRGLSTDEKPDGIPNGSDFLEIDTGKISYYDAASGEWIEPMATDDQA